MPAIWDLKTAAAHTSRLAIGLRLRCLKHKLLLIFGGVYVFLSLFTMLHFLDSSLLGDRFYRTQFEAMYYGTAWKPFVYRILIPKVTRSITEATPQALQDRANNAIESWKFDPDFKFVRDAMPWLLAVYPQKNRNYPRMVSTVLIFGCLWGYILMLYKLGAVLFPGREAVKWFAPIFGMLVISSFSWQWNYVYDIPVLFLSTACFYFMAVRQFRPYLLFFILACLNKESAIFIFIFYTLWCFHRLDTRTYVTLWGAQCFIYAVIKIVLTFTFWQNPGWFLENNMLKVLGGDVFALSKFSKIFFIAGFFFLLTYRWEEKPLFLKYGLWLLPGAYTAYIWYGYPGEYRVFFDVMPLMILLVTHTLIAGTGIADSRLFASEERAP